MENEVKQRNQRNRRRERAQRMQAQRESKVKDGDSGEDESPAREKPPRPPARRKKSKEPLGEEDIIDGFAIMAFRTYEDLEAAIKCVSSPRTASLTSKPRLPLAALASDGPRAHPPNNVNSHGITLLQDAGTSDDSGRASERLTGSSVAPRDPDSSRDRLSDASSRCSSGKGYICDSEGDDDKASPDNSRNGSPRYHDTSMEDASEANSLFRVAGAGTKNELVARGGSGGALALSRAPVGGSASPAPAPLPQPAPSPAPAALPPPALPPPPFRTDTPHRQNGAHIPAIDGQAATQIPARPVGAAQHLGPNAPERPAGNKLQPGARANADSPTPAPPAPPAPSPLFPSHTAYQAHAAPALPDYRHTNHETRTKPSVPDLITNSPISGPLNLHTHHQSSRPQHHHTNTVTPAHPSLSNHTPHSQMHPLMTGHDVRNSQAISQNHTPNPSSLANHIGPLPNHLNGLPQNVAAHSVPSSVQCSLPNQTLTHQAGRPISPSNQVSRSYPTLTGSSHINSSLSSSIHSHSIPYQSQSSSLHKHSVQSLYGSRPSHLPPFSSSNSHMPNHIPVTTGSHSIMTHHISHSTNNHSLLNHTSHLPSSNSSALTNHSTTNHTGTSPTGFSSANSHPMPNYSHSHKHSSGVSLPPHINSISTTTSNHLDVLPPTSSVPTIAPSVSSANSHPILVPTVDSRQLPVTSNDLSSRTESPAVAVSLSATNGYHPPPAAYAGTAYPPLYAPYATSLQNSPYLPPSAASPRNSSDMRTSLSASPLIAPKTPKGVRPHTPGTMGAAGTAPPPPITHTPHSYSPRGHSPTRERDSYSSNISSLSRASGSTPVSSSAPPVSCSSVTSVSAGSVTTGTPMATVPVPLVQSVPTPSLVAPLAAPLSASMPTPLATSLAAPLATPLTGPLVPPLAAPTPTPAAPAATHLTHSLAPVPTVPSISSSAKPPAHWGVTSATAERAPGFPPAPLFGGPIPPSNPNPFSAESLFQSSPGADLLRRELDNRFLAAAGGAFSVRTEMHHHQHQHTHVHQHPPQMQPTHPAPPTHPHHQLYVPPPPLFKDVGKMASLYRTGLGLGYSYASSLLHPPSPYVPPTPLSSYAPKPIVSAASEATKPTRPAVMKTGKWNAMHVRIAWEIYNHQQKEKSSGSAAAAGAVAGAAAAAAAVAASAAANAAAEKDKLRSFPAPPGPYRSPYDLPPSPYLPPHHPHLGVSPFARYGAGAYAPAPPHFGLSPYARDLALSSSLHSVHHPSSLAALHDAWRPSGPPRVPAPPPPSTVAAEVRREQEERERARREREERERRDKEERDRRKQRERELERVRQRSPLRNGVPEPLKEERKEPLRPPPPMPAYAPTWDPYRAFDPLQHMRFTPLVEAAIRAEEDRAKMLSAYAAHHQQLKPSPLLHRTLPPHGPLPPLGPHGPLAPLGPLAPPLGPLAPLDLLKKEEPR